jgi:hypothetical protein
MRMKTGLNCTKLGSVMGSCEHDNELSCPLETVNFLTEQISVSQVEFCGIC